MTLLKVENIDSGYGQTEILHNVSMELGPGEIVSIIGPNGAGKSTLLKSIFGLLTPSRGTIHIQGRNLTGMAPNRIVRCGLSYVPQVDNVFPSLTVEENLEMGAFILKSHKRVQVRMESVFEFFPILKDRRNQRAGKMSGGERQLVAMACSLMLEPRALLLDEPTAALAPMMGDMVFEKIAEINAKGVSILIVEQNARKALGISHRGYVLVDGRNKLEGTGKELLADPEVSKVYLGG